ncbi:DoxX family protein [Sphingomicrobium lutaoense]|uniref:Putative oxidoreductase n=1 Tax=Sphingomicrobium lutaoense TaxID=515949 RepID=A0A839Z0G4_9SPHN|nr:DoxX family protein [Sphingomicrobium lutaoense]MBB3764048.1 putative oxidoreductase [Sphingomicrobium lutaoense]
MRALHQRWVAFAEQPWVRDFLLLFTRIALGAIFWQSGRTKVEEGSLFTLSDTTFFLFEEEYSGVPLPPEWAAYMATAAEHLLPLLLLVGLASRIAAAGLVAMTMVIQIFVYPDAWWVPHMGWIAMGLVILALGPGRLSLDHLIARRWAQ